MNDQADNFDNTPEGREMIALLARHAPAPPDTHAAARAVLQRLHEQNPRGRVISLRWIGPLVGAAAAVALAFVIMNPPETPVTPAPPAISDKPAETPGPQPRLAASRPLPPAPAFVTSVRGAAGDEILLASGLKHGLRVGDTLQGPGGVTARVTAVGIFNARAQSTGPISRGAELRAEMPTAAMRRAAQYAELGGDPGAFFEFGAVLAAMPMADARMIGIADGRALLVTETFAAILREVDQPARPSLAARIGLRAGDVVIEVNGAAVRTLNDFTSALGWSLDPQVLHVRVIRNGRELELKLN